MKKIICGIVFGISGMLILGIAGGVDHGEPISNILWCVPLMLAMYISWKIGKFTD